MKKIALLFFVFLFGIVANAQIPLRNYVNLSNTILNDQPKEGWGLPNTNLPNFSDEFNSFSVDTLYRDPITHIADKNYFLINGKWRWFWANHSWGGMPSYFKFENIADSSDNTHADLANPSYVPKFISMYAKHEAIPIIDEPNYIGAQSMAPMKMDYSVSMLMSGVSLKPNSSVVLNPGHDFR